MSFCVLLILGLRYDYVIINATIVDGTGSPRYNGDVGIKDGIIISVGNVKEREDSRYIINGTGYILTPGFIDVHTHLDIAPFFDPSFLPQLSQGITTIATGMCGLSPAPSNQDPSVQLYTYFKLGDIQRYKERPFTNFSIYLDELDKINISVNMIPLVGHGAIRNMVLGNRNKKPSIEEMQIMKDITTGTMKSGAFGMTTGLAYTPGAYSDVEELIELSKIVKEYGGIFMSHIRSESDDVIESVKEVISVAKGANIPSQVHHLKVCGMKNAGKGEEVLKLIEKAREDGLDITADQYPYLMSSTGLSSILPPWALEGGSNDVIARLENKTTRAKIRIDILNGLEGFDDLWMNVGNDPEKIVIVSSPGHPEYSGKSLKELAGNADAMEWSFDYLINSSMKYTRALYFEIVEQDFKSIVKKDYVMVGSDTQFVNLSSSDKVHPRSLASHSRFLRQYVREEKLLSLEEAIRKMTGFPAQRYGVETKGFIKPGFDADITLFKLENVDDTTKETGMVLMSKGFDFVFVNGILVVNNSIVQNEKRPGKILRRHLFKLPTSIPNATIPTKQIMNTKYLIFAMIVIGIGIGFMVFGIYSRSDDTYQSEILDPII